MVGSTKDNNLPPSNKSLFEHNKIDQTWFVTSVNDTRSLEKLHLYAMVILRNKVEIEIIEAMIYMDSFPSTKILGCGLLCFFTSLRQAIN